MEHCFWDHQDNRLPEGFWNYQDSCDWLSVDDLFGSSPPDVNRKVCIPQTPSPCHILRPINSVMLHTPPNSPPSNSVSENDLDNILNAFPEILEAMPPGCMQDFGSILNDLQSTLPIEEPSLPLLNGPEFSKLEGYPSAIKDFVENKKTLAERTETVKRDIMLSWGWDLYSNNESLNKRPAKLRTISETSSDGLLSPVGMTRLSPIRYSDEEYLPETPGMSDVDIEDGDVTDSLGPSSLHTSSVNNEHNYCEKSHLVHRLTMDTPSSSDSDEEVDVESICTNPTNFYTARTMKPSSSTFDERPTVKIVYKPASYTSSPQRTTEDTKIQSFTVTDCASSLARSAQVKRQLQISIQESMKNKQTKRGKMVRTSSEMSGESSDESFLDSSSSSESSSERLSFSSSPSSASGPLFRPHGKPEAYTKRIREQHETETAKKCKKRKLSGGIGEFQGDDIERRIEHNAMERKRRVGIKNLFENLKTLLPSISENKRASKIMILREATILSQYYSKMETTRQALLHQQTELLQRLNNLDKKQSQVFRCSNRQINL